MFDFDFNFILVFSIVTNIVPEIYFAGELCCLLVCLVVKAPHQQYLFRLALLKSELENLKAYNKSTSFAHKNLQYKHPCNYSCVSVIDILAHLSRPINSTLEINVLSRQLIISLLIT